MDVKTKLNNFNSFKNYVNKSLEAQLTELNKKVLKKAIPKFAKKFDQKLANFYELSVDKFYEGYSPLIYDRRGSLYNLLVTNYDSLKRTYDIEFDPNKITYSSEASASHSRGEFGLYNTVFRGGFHGGAYHDGDYYWRTPHPDYYAWGRPAAYEELSVLEDFKSRLRKYETGKMKTDFNKIYLDTFRSLY